MPDDVKKILVFDGTFGRIENEFERISKYKVKTESKSNISLFIFSWALKGKAVWGMVILTIN